MSLTQCTHPDAPFYELDLIGLSFADAYGLDMPCQTMITVGATSLALIWGCLAALAFWGITKTIRNMTRIWLTGYLEPDRSSLRDDW